MALLSLLVKLTLDKVGFDAGLSSARKAVSGFASSIGSHLAAAFGTAAIAAYTKHLIEYAHHIEVASKRTGINTDALQTLGHAAKLSGVELDELVSRFGKLSKARQEALEKPKGKKAAIFEALGVSPEELKAGGEDLFRAIGRGFHAKDFGVPTEQAMMIEMFGRGADALLPMLANVDELEEGLRRTGSVIQHEHIEQLAHLHDQWVELTAQIRGPFTEALIGVLMKASELVNNISFGFKVMAAYVFGFEQGFKRVADTPKTLLQRLPTPFNVGRNVREGIKATAAGHEEAMSNVQATLGEEVGNALAGAFGKIGKEAFGALLNVIAPRPKADFLFDKEEKEKKERQPHFKQGDILGRIGGGVGGGDATQTKLTELVREMKELRRTLEIHGVRITGEL